MPTAAHPRSPTAELEARFEAELGPLVATLLGVVGPMAEDRIRVVLTRAGHFDPLLAEGFDHADLQGLVAWVVDDELAFFRTADDLVAHVASLLDGIALSHVLTADEARREMLDLGDDLAVLARGRLRLPLCTGGDAVVHHRWDQHEELTRAARELGLPTDPLAGDDGSLVGPPGWLAGLAPARPLVVRLGDDRLALSRAGSAPLGRSSPRLLEALAAAAERRSWPTDGGEASADLLLDALAHDPTLLRRPDAPLSVALAELGLRPERRVDDDRKVSTSPGPSSAAEVSHR